jgi:small GTP-binding protein
MQQKKICMLGAFAVGKTSLVRRYVDSIFSDAYLTTVGVKIDKHVVTIGDETLNLILWDIAGEDDVSSVRMSYLRGASGYFLVVDGTRAATLDVARSIQQRAEGEIGSVPFIALVNKLDVRDEWTVAQESLAELEDAGWSVALTSARTGEGVEAAFRTLAERMLRPNPATC